MIANRVVMYSFWRERNGNNSDSSGCLSLRVIETEGFFLVYSVPFFRC